MGTFFKKLIPSNIAGIIGVVQALIPLVRELIIVGIRILDVITPADGLERAIVVVATTADKIESWIATLKNMFLGA